MFRSLMRRKPGVISAFSIVALAVVPRVSDAGTTSCNIPQACALYTNANGPGLAGTSSKNEGIVGTTTFAGTTTSNRTYGVEGIDGSTNKSAYNVGVYGKSSYGLGLYGISASGTGVYATTTSGYGVRATASSGTAISGTSSTGNGILGQTSATSGVRAGVTGVDASTNGGDNVGVLGTTTNGGYGVEGTAGDNSLAAIYGHSTDSTAVRAISTSGYALIGESSSGIGAYATGGVGLYASGSSVGAEAFSSSGPAVTGSSSSGAGVSGHSNSGPGVSASSSTADGLDVATGGGIGAYVINSNGNGADIRGSYIGVVGRSDSFPLLLTNASGSDLFYIDGSGNVFTHGTYRTFVATRNGSASMAFTPKSTTPSVEDVGNARLINGTATIAFDAAFGASIDSRVTYHVFLTPNGDTRGLYVAMKTPAGFVVRETQGGRGTLDFDYRVVATTSGHAQERMALVGTSVATSPKATVVTRSFAAPPARVTPTLRGHAMR